MKKLFVWLDKLLMKHKALKRWKRTVTVLAAIITFVTTYALILPAITVEKNQAEEVGGMYLEQEKDRDDLFLENALEPTGIPLAADQENAITFSYVDEEMTATAIFSTDEKILDGSELVVTAVDPESEEYAALSCRSTELLDKEFIYDVTTCSFYDFALFYKNVDVTPQTGLVDIQIIFHDNVVEHVDDNLFAGRFARLADKEDEFVAVSADGNIEADETDNLFEANDELISTNPDDSSVIELTDGIITALSLKGNNLAESDSIVGILAGYVDEEIKAAAAETDAEVPEYDDSQEENPLVDAVEGGEGEAAQAVTTLKATGTDYTVTLTCDAASGVPEGAALTVSEIEEDSKEYLIYLEETKKAMGLAEEDSLPRFAARFFDIKIMVGDEEFKPESGVSVEITYTEPLAETTDAEVNAIHFADEAAKAEVIEANTAEIKDDGTATVEFVAESFSVYGVIYTVDFEYSVNGKMYQFSLPGGGFVSFTDLVEVLGIIGDTNSEVNGDENGAVMAENSGGNAANEGIEENGVNSDTNTTLTLGDVEVSEATRKFVADVTSVEFSSPELVDVSKVDADTTVGQLKENRELECEYSAELTEEQIAEINAQTVEAGDWALISVQAFDTEEYLTVTMKNGDVFTILVTDEQDPLGLDGQAFAIVNTRNGTSTAMKPIISNNRLQGDTVTLSQNGNVPTCSDNAACWVFEYTGDGKYYIKSGDLYLKITGTNNSNWKIELVDREEADPITIAKDGEKYRFLNDNNISINNYGGNFWAGNWNDNNEWMMLRTPYDPNKPAERSTVDSRALGLTINLFDYGPDNGDYNLDHVNNVLGGSNVGNYSSQGINQYSDLKFFSYGTGYGEGTCGINNFTGSSPNHKAAQGIVQNLLSEGYPSLQNEQSLDYLFNSASKEGKTIYSNVNHLFWSEDGKLKYDSDESYAYYNQGTKDFKVYETTYDEEGSTDTDTFKVGFFPFNDYDDRYQCIHGDGFAWGCTGTQNTHGVTDEVGHFNHHFGLSMTGTFKIVNNQDMTFHFSGDDDLWVFVDDVLVLDIGGIHNPIDGDIDFGTTDGSVSVSPNVVAVDGNESYLAPDTIKAAFEKAGKTWDGNDGTYHEIKVFYLERGGMYSNLEMEINLPLVPSGNLQFDKKDDSTAAVPGAEFSLYIDPECQHPLSFKSENAKAVSDENGVVSFEGLPVGTYYMKETAAPAKYELDPDIYVVTIVDKNSGSSIVKNGEGQEITQIVNSEKVVNLSLEKKWNDNGDTSVPANASATFKLMRRYTVTSIPVKLLDKNGGVIDTGNAYLGSRIEIKNESYDFDIPTPNWSMLGTSREDSDTIRTPSSQNGITIKTKKDFNWPWGQLQITSTNTTTGSYTVRNTDINDGEVVLRLNGNSYYNFTSGKTPKLSITGGTSGGTVMEETYGTFTLPADGDDDPGWKKTYSNLPAVDANGNPYTYYFVEVSHTPSEYNIQTITVNGTSGSIGSGSQLTEDSDVIVTNNAPEKPKITAVKVWQDETGNAITDDTGLQGLEVKLTLYKGTSAATADDTSSEITQTVTGNGQAVWNMKSFNADVTQYSVKETAVKISGGDFLDVTTENPFTGTVTGDSTVGYTITNQLPVTELSVTKQWKDGTSANADKVFDSAKTISFTLYQKLGNNDPAVYTGFGTDGVGTITYTPASGSTAASWSTVTAQNLPKYVYSGGAWYEAVYYPVESEIKNVSITTAYQKGSEDPSETPAGAAASSGTVTIINTDIVVPLKIVKIDNNTEQGIRGAKFQLTRKLPGEGGFTKFVHDSFDPDPENGNKKSGPFTVTETTGIILEDLLPGEYHIEETIAPDGYIITLQPFDFTVNTDGTVSYPGADDNALVTIIEKDGTAPAGFEIGNTPGAALPHTGGPGTRLFTILGSILILGAGVLLWRRRRLI
ncbi:MAG: fibro-slime domain-containing protein [Lachnospiraceae bacterium]|nr:fibro-slime domain-containing protein [Lachnospiraceae bacterium]